MSNDDILHSCIYRKVYFARKIKWIIFKNPISSQILSNKINIFTGRQSKPKTEVVFFLTGLTLNWRHSWKSASTRSFGVAHEATCSIQNARFDPKVEDAHIFGISWTCLQRLILTKLCSEKVSFLMIRPIGIVLFKRDLNEF